VVRLQKAMKPKALLGDQTFDHQLTQLRKILTLRPVKKIKHLPMQKSEKCGRIYANLQPHATRKISVVPV